MGWKLFTRDHVCWHGIGFEESAQFNPRWVHVCLPCVAGSVFDAATSYIQA